jgi:hypothetical protein
MISPETRAQIRRYFYVEHWKIGAIASELNVHPDAVRNAIESERFHSTQPLRASVVDPYLGFVRETLDQHPRLRATRIFQMIRDRGVQRQHRAVAACRVWHASAEARTFSATANVSRRAGPSRLGALRSCDGRTRQARFVLLRDDAIVFARLVSGVLLRSNHGELPARPCPRI